MNGQASQHPLLPSQVPVGDMTTQAHISSDTGTPCEIHWRKGEVLGHGSFGTVYMGLDLDTGILMAVKEIRFDQSSMKEIKALRDEIEIMKKLDHPNITQYLGTSQINNYLYILTEWVPGGSIKSLISKFGKFTEQIIHAYTSQILSGLIYLHDNNVLHRDIKPANVLVSDKGAIKLADFGASKQLRDVNVETFEESLKGTPYYIAPEVIIERKYSFASDIWSLGCTVYEMITGSPPWKQLQCGTIASLLYHIANGKQPPTIPSDISIELVSFLNTCFQRRPEERSSARELFQHPFMNKYKMRPENDYDSSTSNTPAPQIINNNLINTNPPAYPHSVRNTRPNSNNSIYNNSAVQSPGIMKNKQRYRTESANDCQISVSAEPASYNAANTMGNSVITKPSPPPFPKPIEIVQSSRFRQRRSYESNSPDTPVQERKLNDNYSERTFHNTINESKLTDPPTTTLSSINPSIYG